MWHLPEPRGILVQPFGPEPLTGPLWSAWNSSLISSTASGKGLMRLASTCVTSKTTRKITSKIITSTSCLFMILEFFFSWMEEQRKQDWAFYWLGSVRSFWFVCVVNTIMTLIYRVLEMSHGLTCASFVAPSYICLCRHTHKNFDFDFTTKRNGFQHFEPN